MPCAPLKGNLRTGYSHNIVSKLTLLQAHYQSSCPWQNNDGWFIWRAHRETSPIFITWYGWSSIYATSRGYMTWYKLGGISHELKKWFWIDLRNQTVETKYLIREIILRKLESMVPDLICGLTGCWNIIGSRTPDLTGTAGQFEGKTGHWPIICHGLDWCL